MTLDELAAGGRVLVDATVFVYHFTGVSQECRAFLERCERGELAASVSVLTLAEVAHRLMMIEAVGKGWVTSGNVARKLAGKPELLRKLELSWKQVERIPLMGLRVVSLELKGLLAAGRLRARFGLMTNDSLIAATAFENGVTTLATADRDFERVQGLAVYRPSDI